MLIPIFIVICLFLMVGEASAARSQPIIINHTTTNLSLVPSAAIDQAKSSLHIGYGHTSHGSQIITGMDGLVTFAGAPHGGSLYTWHDGPQSGALDLRDGGDGALPGDLGAPDRTSWANYTRDYLDANPDIDVIMWSWCGEVSWASEDDINTYLGLMSRLEADYPNVTFVYMTGHLDGSGAEGNLNVRNQQIRDYCVANNKVLYDFADIESYDPDGKYFLDKNATDGCDYTNTDGSTGNWALEWQANHTEGVDWYMCDPAHTQAVNGNRKAYAAWWLYARIAGWGGPNATQEAYTVKLTRGWNLVSLPVANSSLWASKIPADSGVDMVAAFNGDNQTFSVYRVGRGGQDIKLVPDKGYFLNCTQDHETWTFYGAAVSGQRTLTLYPGWNLIGWSPSYNSTAKAFGGLGSNIGRVARYNDGNAMYATYLVGTSRDDRDFITSRGSGYFVYSNAASAITISI